MTEGQNRFYWQLWGAAKKWLVAHGRTSAQAETCRHELHVEALGKDKSHLNFSNRDFDLVKAAFLAISQPGNMKVQIEQEKMPKTRLIRRIGDILCAMGEVDSYVQTIMRTMNREGRIGQRWAHDRDRDERGRTVPDAPDLAEDGRIRRPELVIADLEEHELAKLIIALAKECRRRWKTKTSLLFTIQALIRAEDFDEDTAKEAVCAALICDGLPSFNELTYDRLIVVLGALRRLSGPPILVGEGVDAPF